MRELLDKIQYENLTHEDVWEAKRSGDRERLNEASLGRVYQHVMKADVKSLGIITAFRGKNTGKENAALNKKLGAEIRSAGHGFFRLRGHWRECQDKKVAYKDCPEKDLIDVVELSYGVVGISKELIAKLGRKYNQDSVVYLGPDTGGKAILIFKTGTEEKIGSFHPQKIAQAYSRVKGKTFIFEWVVQSFSDALIEQVLTRNRGSLSMGER